MPAPDRRRCLYLFAELVRSATALVPYYRFSHRCTHVTRNRRQICTEHRHYI